MTNAKILGTGLSGLVGSRVVELLRNKYEFEDLSLDTGVDITDEQSVKERVSDSESPLILHMAAKTDVDGCEDDKILGEEGGAWMVNVIGTSNIVEAARATGKKVIYISTDFVFDGTKDFYTEEDEPNPINWYAITKHEGEKKIIEANIEYIIARISYPYSAFNSVRPDFVHRIIERFEKKEKIAAVTDHIFTPSYIDDIAYALDFLFSHNLSGVFHLVGNQSITPYTATNFIADHFKYDKNLITEVKREDYFKGRAFRPFKLALKNDKITKFGIKMRPFTEGLKEFK